jgi:uncharacterized lipoprotein YmbA
MMARLPRLVPGLVLIVLCLAACASGPATPIEYYVLAPQVSAADSVVERSNRPTLVIENVDLAAYLRQTGMIIQTGNNQILVSRTHLWAESLESALPKALVRELQRQSDDYSYYLKSVDWVGETDYRLRLRIDSLQSTDRGEVVSAGRYQLISAAAPGSPVVVDFNLARDLDQDGYAYAVEQIGLLIGQIAGAILASVDKLELED